MFSLFLFSPNLTSDFVFLCANSGFSAGVRESELSNGIKGKSEEKRETSGDCVFSIFGASESRKCKMTVYSSISHFHYKL